MINAGRTIFGQRKPGHVTISVTNISNINNDRLAHITSHHMDKACVARGTADKNNNEK